MDCCRRNCTRAGEFSRDFEIKLNSRLDIRTYFDDHFDHFNCKKKLNLRKKNVYPNPRPIFLRKLIPPCIEPIIQSHPPLPLCIESFQNRSYLLKLNSSSRSNRAIHPSPISSNPLPPSSRNVTPSLPIQILLINTTSSRE